MSAEMMVRAWKTEGLTPAERLVLLALADCADRTGTNAFRSESTIADHTLLSLRTVKRSVQGLRAKRLIVIQELPTNRRATTYRLFPDEAVRGDNQTPQTATAGGDRQSPRRVRSGGDNETPLGVTSGVTSVVTFRDPSKEDPVDPVDPVDPRLANLLVTAVDAELAHDGDWSDELLLLRIRRRVASLCGGRVPVSDAALQALLTRQRGARRAG